MTGTVTIRDKQWSVTLATTYAELTSGLSGLAELAPSSGMLFDMGLDATVIQINMAEMLFPLDIIFINSTQGVVGVMRNVQPGEAEVDFQSLGGSGARYFLEVNAGEAEGVESGDAVDIQGAGQATAIDMGAVMQGIIATVVVVAVVGTIGKGMLWGKEEQYAT